jgi:capsid portal protein
MKTPFWALALALSAYATDPARSAPAGTAALPPQVQTDAQTETGVSTAQARLEIARRNYQDAVAQLARSLNLDMRAVEANRQDLNLVLPNFIDEEVQLRQRFGDGD